LCANYFAALSRRLSLQEGKDKGVATLTASADSSIFRRVPAALALPLGRNRHLVNSMICRHCERFPAKQSPHQDRIASSLSRAPRNDIDQRVHALSFPDVLPIHLLLCNVVSVMPERFYRASTSSSAKALDCATSTQK
jgi:hypothetical protein